MKRLAAVLMMLGATLCSVTGAQAGKELEWRGSGGWGAGTAYSRLYDAGTLRTVQGRVVKLERLTPRAGMAEGAHLRLETDHDALIDVHLGPVWYLERQDFPIAKGDRVAVTGSRVEFDGRPVVLAADVIKDNKVLVLRERNGFPLWSGWRARKR